MPYLIACPSCRRQLRVQTEYAGRQLACPTCDAVFIAPQPPPEPGPAASPAAAAGEEGYWIEGPRRVAPGSTLTELYPPRLGRSKKRQRAKSAVLPPAICLIIVGGLTFCVYFFFIVINLIDPSLTPVDELKAQRTLIDPDVIRLLRMLGRVAGLLGGAYVAIAGLYMMMLKGHAFALSGAYVAMIPCCVGLGCVPGIPFGIWSLVVLYNSDVRSKFR